MFCGSHCLYALSWALTVDMKIRLELLAATITVCYVDGPNISLLNNPQILMITCFLSSYLTALAIEVGFPCVSALYLLGVKVQSGSVCAYILGSRVFFLSKESPFFDHNFVGFCTASMTTCGQKWKKGVLIVL
jgi:hypothetical protein